MNKLVLAIMAGSLLALASCGTDPRDRTEGGAAAGATSGAGIGIVGGPVGMLLGGVIGGGAGALTGATTSPKQVDLGTPPWSDR
jgi:phage tail tape-measure protein